MVGGYSSAVVACLLGLAQASVCAGDPPLNGPGLQRVTWRELRFAAHKLGISATIDVRLEEAPGDPSQAGGARLPDGGSQRPSPLRDLVLESTTHLPGRTFVARERLDPVQAKALEIVDTETGAKHHRKTYTLTPRGFLLDLLEPASVPQMLLPPERWTRQTRSFTAYPLALPAGTTITGPAGLLYAASTASLASPGDSFTIHVLVQTQVERLTVRVEGLEPVQLDFQESSGGRLNPVREQVAALRLVAHSQPVDPASSSVFRIFGLEGDVQILWDPVRRLPVQIAGQVKMLGHVEVRLASATMR